MKLQALDRKFTVHLGDNDVPVRGLFCAIDDHDVAITQPQFLHAAATGTHKKRGGAPADAELVKVKFIG